MKLGRTHQIRVHLASIGHPIIGDSLYGNESSFIKRQALHSIKTTFIHPIYKIQVTYTAPIPKDMKVLYDI